MTVENKVTSLHVYSEDMSSIEDELNSLEFHLGEIQHYLKCMENWDSAGRKHATAMVDHAMAKVYQRSHRAKLIGRGQHIHKPR